MPKRCFTPAELPSLPEYHTPPEDPRTVAAPYDPDLVELYTDYINHGGDGLILALAPPKPGHSRREAGASWVNSRTELRTQGTIGFIAVYNHAEQRFWLDEARVNVDPATPGMDSFDYALYVLNGPLYKPRREEDTDVRLRTHSNFVVPGTRFSDPFPTDNTHAAFGYMAAGQIDKALESLAGIQHNTMRFGYPENFSKLAMLRSQTPVDSFAMEATRGLYGAAALLHWKDALVRNVSFWMAGKDRLSTVPPQKYKAHRRIGRLPGGLFAHRNWDDTPVDFTKKSVIRVESAGQDRETGERAIASVRDKHERAYIWWRTQKSLAAGAESFQDMSDYQLADRINLETTRTIDIYPSWLQASIAHKTRLAAEACELGGDFGTAQDLWEHFNNLKQVVQLCWRQTGPDTGHFTDLLKDGTQTGALNAAQLFPLLVGNNFITYEQGLMSINLFRKELLGPFGLHTSDILECPEQWTGHKAWPSLAILAMHASMEQAREAKRRGQDPEPFIQFAEDVQTALQTGIDAWYEAQGTLPERINGDDPTAIALGGEYCSPDENGNPPEPQTGFAMTAGALIVAKTFNLREIFGELNLNRSWLSQAFALNLGRVAALAN